MSSQMNLDSIKSFSQLPSNSPEEDDQDQQASLDMPTERMDGSPEHWPEQYDMAVFLLTHFNVHYMSWIKNSAHLSEYMERFSCIYDRVIQMPEFEANSQMDSQLKDWLIDRAITRCL